MSGTSHDGPVRRPADHSWVLTAWVLPLAVAFGITVATAGFGALVIVPAVMIGLVSTVLHFAGRD
jgi:hypothetical protein